MKKTLSVCLLILAFISCAMAQSVPAFPGAEGHGRYVTGGRGGKIIHVTTLEDNSNVGSLRYALTKVSGPRIIVFDVAGYIDLKSELPISKGDVTIAGQTAPYPGITLRYYPLKVNANNVIIRFIRCRHSQLVYVNDSSDACWGKNLTNVIIDHCSFSWSIDETASFYDNKNFTLQWSSVCESLNEAGHDKGAHGYGGIWGGKGASFHHNLLAHHTNRVPRLNGARFGWNGSSSDNYASCIAAEIVDLRNCVMYNWGTGNGAYGAMGGNHNIINNYYKAGPATYNKTRVFQCSTTNKSDGTGTKASDFPWGVWGKFHISGNYVTAAGANAANYDWNGVTIDKCKDAIDNQGNPISTPTKDQLKLTSPVESGSITTHSAETAFEKVLKFAGSSLCQDEADIRYAEEARTGTAKYTGPISKKSGIADFVESLTGTTTTVAGVEYTHGLQPSFPVLESTSRPLDYDADMDGMPDQWEIDNGLNPNDASDANTYTIDNKKWYTNIEVYINSIVEDIMKNGNADAVSSVNEYYPVCIRRDNTPIDEIEADLSIVNIEYYSLKGQRIPEPGNGISVRRFIYSNGTSKSDLVIKKK